MKKAPLGFTLVAAVALLAGIDVRTVHADSITVESTATLTSLDFVLGGETAGWLFIGTASRDYGTTVSVNSGFELGAHLPLDGQVPTDGGGQGPDIGDVTQPVGAIDPEIGIGLNGDTALTDPTGTFNFQTIDGDSLLDSTIGQSGVYGDTGVQCSQAVSSCTDGNSNTYYNSTGEFPMPDTLLAEGNGIVEGDASTFEDLRAELDAVRDNIGDLESTGTLPGGTLTGDLYINLLNPGIHVLDVSAIGGDWNLGNYDIVIDGPEGAFLIIRIPDGVNMLTANSWIGIGDGGIGLNNVLFYTSQTDNDAHFSFQNTVFNGVAFWDLSTGVGDGADLQVDNGQGCAQFVAPQIVMNDVRLNYCGPSFTVPEPNSLALLLAGVLALGSAVQIHRRRK
jgi:hypothetical protein